MMGRQIHGLVVQQLLGITFNNGVVIKMIKVKRLTETAVIPTRGSEQAAGLDLYADSSIVVKAGTHAIFQLVSRWRFLTVSAARCGRVLVYLFATALTCWLA